jgi:hypothetical protein
MCHCDHPDHLVRLEMDTKYDEMSIYVLLCSGGLWTRFKKAVKYMFNGRTNDCLWAEVLLQNEDLPRLVKLIQDFQEHLIENKRTDTPT